MEKVIRVLRDPRTRKIAVGVLVGLGIALGVWDVSTDQQFEILQRILALFQ